MNTTIKFVVNRSSNQRSVVIKRNRHAGVYCPVTPASLARIETIMRRYEITQSVYKCNNIVHVVNF